MAQIITYLSVCLTLFSLGQKSFALATVTESTGELYGVSGALCLFSRLRLRIYPKMFIDTQNNSQCSIVKKEVEFSAI